VRDFYVDQGWQVTYEWCDAEMISVALPVDTRPTGLLLALDNGWSLTVLQDSGLANLMFHTDGIVMNLFNDPFDVEYFRGYSESHPC
jgi:hypothetical protein